MRRLLFAALLASLLAVLLLAGLHGSTPTARMSRATTTVAPRRPTDGPPPTEARPQVRRFIVAFLSFEVGVGGPAVEAAIHARASRHLARQLLSDPPRTAGRPARAGALITSFHIDPVRGRPGLALASGDARRPGGPEPFSFLFARRDGRWLAVAPGE
jgi:hypothetical protein